MQKKRFEEFETDAQVLAESELVARSFYHAAPVSLRMCEFQGMFSKSAVVTLSDEKEVVVQLKDNEIDSTKTALANSLLGDVVPVSFAAISNTTFAYVSRFIPGRVWLLRENNLTVEENSRVAAQVGVLIAKCVLGNTDGSGMVDAYVVPRLLQILSKPKMTNKLKTRIQGVLKLSDGVKALPLSLCHIDINSMNIILDESAKVVGLVDWEQAQLLPVGMNAWCIRYLSVPINGGVDEQAEKSQPMAEAFWRGFTAVLPPHLHTLKDRIVDSMLIGLVLFSFPEGCEIRKSELSLVLERLDWIESTFRPMCSSSE